VIRAVPKLLLVAVLVALVIPAAATAASPIQIIRDCNDDGNLDHHYSNKDLKRAVNEIPSDLDEYTNCSEIIGGAITGGSDKGGGRGDEGGNPNSPREQAARAKDAQKLSELQSGGGSAGSREKPEVDVGGETVKPSGSTGLYDNVATSANSMPTSLLIALIALALLAAGGAAYALRDRLPALAKVPSQFVKKIRPPRVGQQGFRR
jgi:hypothetical protein